MTGRLILAIVSTVLEEVALVIIVLWGLPQIGVQIPLWGLIALMAAWSAISIFIYRAGSRALRRKPVLGLPAMIGSKGKAISPLAPSGFIRIRGELWDAISSDDRIDTGEEVTIVGQDGLKLVVHKSSKGRKAGDIL